MNERVGRTPHPGIGRPETGFLFWGGGIGRTRSFRARGVSGRVLENGDLS